KALGLEGVDALTFSYGQHKFVLGAEARASSKELLTVERSALANKVYGSLRPTGFSSTLTKGNWSVTGTLFSTDEGRGGGNNEFLGGWNDGLAWYAGVGWQASEAWTLH